MGKPLRIAILGAGNIGGTLGKKWSAAGHHVAFGVSNPEGQNAQVLRATLGERATIGTLDEVLKEQPEVVLVALPGAIIESVAQKYASQLDSRIIIDASNRIGEDSLHNLEHFQRHTPGAQLYRAFNSLGWENFAEPTFHGIQADLFYCGASGEAKASVEQLIADIGLRPVYLGGNEQLGLLDALTSLWFTLALQQKKGRHLAFKVLSDEHKEH